jgi:hypothetical protein
MICIEMNANENSVNNNPPNTTIIWRPFDIQSPTVPLNKSLIANATIVSPATHTFVHLAIHQTNTSAISYAPNYYKNIAHRTIWWPPSEHQYMVSTSILPNHLSGNILVNNNAPTCSAPIVRSRAIKLPRMTPPNAVPNGLLAGLTPGVFVAKAPHRVVVDSVFGQSIGSMISFGSFTPSQPPLRAGPKTERPFKCHSCAVGFWTAEYLQKHERSLSHNPRPFTCADCKVDFRRRDHLAKHLRSRKHMLTRVRVWETFYKVV